MARLGAADRSCTRCAWLAAKLILENGVSYSAYELKTKRSRRSFNHDLALVSDAGLEIEAVYGKGRVRLVGVHLS